MKKMEYYVSQIKAGVSHPGERHLADSAHTHSLNGVFQSVSRLRHRLIEQVLVTGKPLSPSQLAELFSTIPQPPNFVAGVRLRKYGAMIAGLPLPLLIDEPGRRMRDAMNRERTKAAGLEAMGGKSS